MGFERCHPAVNLIFFTVVIWGSVSFSHPIFLAVTLLASCAYCVKKCGKKALFLTAALVPCAVAFAVYYSSYNHFGLTVLGTNFVGNNMTLDTLVYGLVLGLCFVALLLWFACLFKVFTTDKIVFLFSRLSPKISLFISILLRFWPRLKTEARKINTARQGIGRGINQGSFFQRVTNGISIFSMLISWIIGALAQLSSSMQSRGSSLRGRTAYSIYRFDNRDRAFVVIQFFCLTLTVMAIILKFTTMVYDPKIIWRPLQAMNYVFYAAYAIFCLMPLILEVWTEYNFRKSRNSM